MKQFTAHAEYNMETKKPYVEIKRDGEHKQQGAVEQQSPLIKKDGLKK